MSTVKTIKSALESMMFVWGDLLSVSDAAQALGISGREARNCFEELKKEYEEERRGLRIRRVENSYQLVTAAENADYIERLCRPVKRRKLSNSALEVLAIVAYRQPVTRGQIDQVRGVRSDKALEGLMKKGLVNEKGRSEGIGRPILYGTTAKFLKTFGYSDLGELPDIDGFSEERDDVEDNQISLEDVSKDMEKER